jgi:hypothetical protein
LLWWVVALVCWLALLAGFSFAALAFGLGILDSRFWLGGF